MIRAKIRRLIRVSVMFIKNYGTYCLSSGWVLQQTIIMHGHGVKSPLQKTPNYHCDTCCRSVESEKPVPGRHKIDAKKQALSPVISRRLFMSYSERMQAHGTSMPSAKLSSACRSGRRLAKRKESNSHWTPITTTILTACRVEFGMSPLHLDDAFFSSGQNKKCPVVASVL